MASVIGWRGQENMPPTFLIEGREQHMFYGPYFSLWRNGSS